MNNVTSNHIDIAIAMETDRYFSLMIKIINIIGQVPKIKVLK